MKQIINFFILTSFLLSANLATSQYGAQSRADYYFSKFSYVKAIVDYEKMVKNDFYPNYAHGRLAECFLLLRQYKKAIPHFEAIINDKSIPPDYYLKYAMALRSIDNLKESKKWLKKYQKLHENDPLLKRYLKDGNIASIVFNSRERYEIFTTDLNSPQSDFGVSADSNGNLYFASSRVDEKSGKLYGWNEEPLLDIFKVNPNFGNDKPKRISGDINTKFHESSLVFINDSTEVYFTRNNYYKNKKGSGEENITHLKIYRAKLINNKWVVNLSININRDEYSITHPAISPDGKTLFFTSDKPGGYGGKDIYYASIGERGKISSPKNAGPVVNTSEDEMFPFVNREGKLFFSSEGHVGYGQLDVFSALTDKDGNYIDVINLGKPLNSTSDDFAYFELSDSSDGYVSSNREGGKGADDIYRFKFQPSLTLKGTVIDGVNKQPLSNVTITLYDQATNQVVKQTTTDANGKYQIVEVDRNKNYMIEAVRKTHPHKNTFFNTYTTPYSAKEEIQDVTLDPVLDLKILADLNKIYFDYDKSNIRPDAALELDKVVKLMTVTYKQMIIRLESHTDPVGSNRYNDNLSKKRAKSTYDYLIDHGVPKYRILSYEGFGKRRPINECTSKEDCTPEELELNRRSEFPIVQIK